MSFVEKYSKTEIPYHPIIIIRGYNLNELINYMGVLLFFTILQRSRINKRNIQTETGPVANSLNADIFNINEYRTHLLRWIRGPFLGY